MSPYEKGLRYMDRFEKTRRRARRSLEEYRRVIDLKGSSDYSRDRVQTFRISDPTYLAVERLELLRKKWTKAESDYEQAIEDLDKVLSQVKQGLFRTVICLYYIDGRSVGEMAEMLIKRDGSRYKPDTISNVKHQAITEIGKHI